MPRAQPEAAIQRDIMAYLRVALPPTAVATAFPAGGGGKARGGRLKAMGLVTGMPDIIVFWAGSAYGLEVKAPAGRLSDEQRLCHARLSDAGIKVAIVRSVEEAECTLVRFGVWLRATVLPKVTA